MGKIIVKSAWLLPIALVLLYLFYNSGNKPTASIKADGTSMATVSTATAPQTLLSPPQTQTDFAYDLTCQVLSVTDDVSLICLTDTQQKVRVKLGKVDLLSEELTSTDPSEFKQGEEPNTFAQIAALQTATTANAAGNFSCGSKRYCKQMTNCAEARFYLNQCGLTRLDADGDGVPCETLCR